MERSILLTRPIPFGFNKCSGWSSPHPSSWWGSNLSFLRPPPGTEGPAGGLVVVFRAGFLHRAVFILRSLLLLQKSRAQSLAGRLHPSHLLIDGGLRAGLSWPCPPAGFHLKATKTGDRQITEWNKQITHSQFPVSSNQGKSFFSQSGVCHAELPHFLSPGF